KHIRNILILIIVIAIGAGFYLMRGDTARLPLEATAGVDPPLTDVRKENFPTINVAEAVPWQDDEGPVAAEGLTVELFGEGLERPRIMRRLPMATYWWPKPTARRAPIAASRAGSCAS